MRHKNATCWEELRRDVIEQDLLEVFFGWLRSIVGNFLERFVNRCKDCTVSVRGRPSIIYAGSLRGLEKTSHTSIIGSGAIKDFDKIRVLID